MGWLQNVGGTYFARRITFAYPWAMAKRKICPQFSKARLARSAAPRVSNRVDHGHQFRRFNLRDGSHT